MLIIFNLHINRFYCYFTKFNQFYQSISSIKKKKKLIKCGLVKCFAPPSYQIYLYYKNDITVYNVYINIVIKSKIIIMLQCFTFWVLNLDNFITECFRALFAIFFSMYEFYLYHLSG